MDKQRHLSGDHHSQGVPRVSQSSTILMAEPLSHVCVHACTHTHKYDGLVILECEHTSCPGLTFGFEDSGVGVGSRPTTQESLPPSRFAWVDAARTSMYIDLRIALLSATTMGYVWPRTSGHGIPTDWCPQATTTYLSDGVCGRDSCGHSSVGSD